MNNWFRTGGGPCTLPKFGCGPIVLVGLFSLFAGLGFGTFLVVIATEIWGLK